MPCSNCGTIAGTGRLCNTCGNFKLCAACYEQDGHPHEMQPFRLPTQACAMELRELPVQRFVQALTIAYNSQATTNRFSQVLFAHLAHTKLACNCPPCKQILLLYRYHNKKCRMSECLLEHCPVIRDKLVKKRLAAARSEDMERKVLRLRLAVKNVQAAAFLREAAIPPRSGALSRKFTIQRCIRTLVHASRCTEASCMPSSCQKMKRILTHIKICKFRAIGGCIICRQLCTLCCYHAKNCHENRCPVPLCAYVKRKLQHKAVAAKFDL